LKPDVAHVIKEFPKDTKIIMPTEEDTRKELKKVSGNPEFAKKELEKHIDVKKIIDPNAKKEAPKPVKKDNAPEFAKDNV